MKQIISLLLAAAMLLSLGVGAYASGEASSSEPASAELPGYDVRSMADQWVYHESMTVSGDEIDVPYYSLEGVCYCTNVVDERYEYLNMYVPACYMKQNADGTAEIDPSGVFTNTTVDGKTVAYTADTAPILYINTLNGYDAGSAPTVTGGRPGQDAGYYYQFLEQGLIMVGVAGRGRNSRDENGESNGLVPEGLTDLKAGVRWLKYNDAYLPGDSNKIVSMGSSSGGAMSAMLGATGNSPDFDFYLDRIGALDATDNVWASVCYCPMANLEFDDGVAEWQYGVKEAGERFDGFTAAMSRALYCEFVAYMQSLGFDLGNDGESGAFYEEYLRAWEDSFNKYIADNFDNEADIAAFITQNDPDGVWLSWDAKNGVKITSVHDYVKYYWGDSAMDDLCPMFDVFEGTTTREAAVFGDHFSWITVKAFRDIAAQYPEAAALAEEYQTSLDNGIAELARLYDPFVFIVEGESDVAEHWRFGTGGADSNVPQAIAWTLYWALREYRDVEEVFYICYGVGHQYVESDPYDVISWIYENDLGVTPAYDNLVDFEPSDTASGEASVSSEDASGEAESPTAAPNENIKSVADAVGVYTMVEAKLYGTVTWTLELLADGTYALSETGIMDKTYTGNYCVAGGYVSCGRINEFDGPRGLGIYAEDDGWYSVWSVDPDNGTCEHANLSEFVDPDAPAIDSDSVVGSYSLVESNLSGTITWTLELKADGTYALSETGIVDMTYTGRYVVANGLVSCGPINESRGPMGLGIYAEDDGWYSVWSVDPVAGTCAHASLNDYVAP